MAAQPQGQVLPPDSEESQEVPLSSTMITAIEEGDRRSMIAAAKANPRSLVVFRKELDDLVSISESVAAEMTYSLPRGSGQIIGPSVRFAEAAAYCYRNLRAISEVVDIGDKQLTAQGTVFDAERNNGRAERVNRNIVGTRGRFNQDMIGTTGNAACSIAYRNAVLHYIPKALWLDSWEKSKQVVTGGVETVAKKRTDALAHFNAMGVTDVMVFNTLGVRGVEDIGTDELVALKTWAREIKSSSRTIEDVFGSPLDEEIERTMKALGWNETQKRVSRTNFAGNRQGHLDYVKGEATKAGITVEDIAPKASAKEGDTAKSAAAAPSETTTHASQQQESQPQEKTTTAQETGTTAEASTSATAPTGAKKATTKKADPGW